MNSHFDDVVDDSKSAVLIALQEPSAKCGICDNACQKTALEIDWKSMTLPACSRVF